ncbi:L-histidine N(alpha)-methyltransferase [Rhodoblastus sp.]|uniref:L-histidine N(alpha)-methyltransferase n=1 Tax=Rhodoblastus sp. TaxID=1962975 RepID=UPI003F9B1B76
MRLERARLPNHADAAFREEVFAGLASPQKRIPCCWLYDARGSQLFEEITRLEEYYPTRAEAEILSRHAGEIAGFCGERGLLFEYGAGSALKSEILIGAYPSLRLYLPIDIAGDMLEQTAMRIGERFPKLDIRPIIADFNQEFELPAGLPPGPRAAFFPGSTIGNLNLRESVAFLRRLRRHVDGRGNAVIGVDLKKRLMTLLNAYDDREGVTAAFNLNLLERINRELDGAFPIDRFAHEARWNAEESAVEMHLVSLDSRIVEVAGHRFRFAAGETIHTESSRKYDVAAFAGLAALGGWRVAKIWRDEKGRFAEIGLEASS